MSERKEIILGRPYLEQSKGCVRLCSDIVSGESTVTAWFEVKDEYAGCLTDDRLDAFVAAFIYKAVTEDMDIRCEAPVSRRLLYQLNEYLLPALAGNIASFHSVHVYAGPTDIRLSSRKTVATGWTGGADSMYTLMKMREAAEPDMRLTHLLIANNGALESDHNEELLRHLVKKAENGIAKDTGLSVIGVNTNLDRIFCETYLAVAGYRLPAAVLALQKLFSVFYNSAGYEFSRFSFVAENSAYYEMFILPNLSTENTVIYSAGGAASRLQKLKELSGYPLAQKYLHPCIYTSRPNCGECRKCIVTQLALYAMGTLDRFDKVFDLEWFYANKDRYIAKAIVGRAGQHYGEAYWLLKEKGLITERARQLAREMQAAETIAAKNRETLARYFPYDHSRKRLARGPAAPA